MHTQPSYIPCINAYGMSQCVQQLLYAELHKKFSTRIFWLFSNRLTIFFLFFLFFQFSAMQAIMLIITMSEENKTSLTVVTDYGVVNKKNKMMRTLAHISSEMMLKWAKADRLDGFNRIGLVVLLQQIAYIAVVKPLKLTHNNFWKWSGV